MITSRILKGGALLNESRILVECWRPDLDAAENLRRLLDENLLAKRSPVRAHDVVQTVLRPRLVEPGPHVIAALKSLVRHERAFTEACYFEAARADGLLAAFAEGRLWDLFQAGRVGLTTEDVRLWISEIALRGYLPAWTERVQERAAQGVLSTLRDFGVLRGAVRKEFAPPRLSPAGFAYVAFRLHEAGVTATGLRESPVWRRWLLQDAEVDQLFAEAAHLGVLRQSKAGSMVRIDWELNSLTEVACAVA